MVMSSVLIVEPHASGTTCSTCAGLRKGWSHEGIKSDWLPPLNSALIIRCSRLCNMSAADESRSTFARREGPALGEVDRGAQDRISGQAGIEVAKSNGIESLKDQGSVSGDKSEGSLLRVRCQTPEEYLR